jgi:pimeloyl-ACP methyl ester carboxylesterase
MTFFGALAMRSLRLAVVLSAALAFVSLADAANVSDFINFSHPSVPGRLYVPPAAADPTNPRPLILFLHGSGETGTNNVSQINGNIDNLLQGAKDRGAFLYAPQATTFTWADTTRTTTVMSMIYQALLDFNVDPDRLYVTGLSMGGGGVWNMLNRFDDRFAAGVPIAAVSPGGFNPANLVGKPTWAFHARDDGTVSPNATRNVVNAVLAAASAPLINYPTDSFSRLEYRSDIVEMNHSEWPSGGHGIWGPVYNIPEMYDWMFSQTLNFDPVAPAGGGQVIMNNLPLYPIADQLGNAIRAGTGFAAVGTFSIPDAAISATRAYTLDLLANSFIQFGASIPVGISNVQGAISGNIGASVAANDPLIGKSIFLVVGNGTDIQSSDSLFVLKSDKLFTFESFQADLFVNSTLTSGQMLLGSHGTVFSTQPRGFRDGIIAAAVNVPEPSPGMAVAFIFVLFPPSRASRR